MAPSQHGHKPQIATQSDLLSRLLHLHSERKPAALLVGAPLSTAPRGSAGGVPSVAGMIELIRAHYATTPADLLDFEQAIQGAENQYQASFEHLLRRRGQDTANQIVRRAVLCAYANASELEAVLPARLDEDGLRRCQGAETDLDGWHLPPGCEALGQLAVRSAATFGACILTTNFDPLLQVAIRKSGGRFQRTVLNHDGDFTQSDSDGCHVVHLHGHWYRSDTLHTAIQLTRPRLRLRHTLEDLLADRTLIVLAYGGWDDVFNAALLEVLFNDRRRTDLLWTFFDDDANRIRTRNGGLLEQLSPGIAAGRVHLYKGIDVHTFLPEFVRQLAPIGSLAMAPSPASSPATSAPATATSPPTGQPESPFFDRGRIKNSSRFFNRERLLDKLFQSLRSGHNISLIGESAIGKSSIMTMICEHGPGKLNISSSNFIYMDMQLIDNDTEFYKTLCGKLGIVLCKGSELAEYIENRGIVLCVDEVEKMKSSGRKGFGQKIRSHLRGMADSGQHLRLVMASRTPLSALFSDDEHFNVMSPMHNIFIEYSVSPFTPEDARQFLQRRLQLTGVVFNREEEDRLLNESSGHPGKLQNLADQLFRRKVGQP